MTVGLPGRVSHVKNVPSYVPTCPNPVPRCRSGRFTPAESCGPLPDRQGRRGYGRAAGSCRTEQNASMSCGGSWKNRIWRGFTLMNQHNNGKSPCLMEETTTNGTKWPFSILSFNYQSGSWEYGREFPSSP